MEIPESINEYTSEAVECVQEALYAIDEAIEKRELTVDQHVKFLNLLAIKIEQRKNLAQHELGKNQFSKIIF